MQALLLNGAVAGDEGLQPIDHVLRAALLTRGWTVSRVQLRDVVIAYCKGCFDCWVKTPGICSTKDCALEVTRGLIRSDLVVLLSPVTFGGYSSEIKKALDRSIGMVSPFFVRIDGEVHHEARYEKYPALLGVGVTSDHDLDERRTFATLVARNAINFHAPAYLAGFVSRDDPSEKVELLMNDYAAQMTAGIRVVQRGAA